jgi:hypothetical protein
MATPVTDLRARLRNAGVTEEQADAISGAFEPLSNQIAELSPQVRNLVGLLLLVAAAILAPYIAAWADMTN